MSTSAKKVNPRKEELISLSVGFRAQKFLNAKMAETPEEALYWEAVRINDLIMDKYHEETGTKDFKTFSDWTIAGFKIKRGEKGWIIWAKKRSAEKKSGLMLENGEPENIEFEFWPICYLFNVHQVEPLNPFYHEN
jgi:hypothetical protein